MFAVVLRCMEQMIMFARARARGTRQGGQGLRGGFVRFQQTSNHVRQVINVHSVIKIH